MPADPTAENPDESQENTENSDSSDSEELEEVAETNGNDPDQPMPYTLDTDWDGNQDYVTDFVEEINTFLQIATNIGNFGKGGSSSNESGNTTKETLAWLRHQHESGSRDWYRMCLSLARQGRGLPSRYPDAISAWQNADDRHAQNHFNEMPRGAPFLWAIGQWGHIATYAGRNKHNYPLVWSNDAKVKGGVSLVKATFFADVWNATPLGWTEDLNGFDLRLNEPNKKPRLRKPRKDKADLLRDWREGLERSLHDAKANKHAQREKILELRLRVVNEAIREHKNKK